MFCTSNVTQNIVLQLHLIGRRLNASGSTYLCIMSNEIIYLLHSFNFTGMLKSDGREFQDQCGSIGYWSGAHCNFAPKSTEMHDAPLSRHFCHYYPHFYAPPNCRPGRSASCAPSAMPVTKTISLRFQDADQGQDTELQ